MAAFMKLGDIPGEATDLGHPGWVQVQSMSAMIHRTIPVGAKDMQRSRGSTILEDVVVLRHLDKSSPKLFSSGAEGVFLPEVLINFCTQVHNRQEPYLKYKLKNVIITGYTVHAEHTGELVPTEEVTLAYTAAEWLYVVVDPKTAQVKGTIGGKFDPGFGVS